MLTVRLRQCVDHPLLVLGRGANEEEETDKLLTDSGDETGSLKQMIAAFAGGSGTDNNAPNRSGGDDAYALQVLKEIGEAERESECFMCTGEIFDEVLLPCYHRGWVGVPVGELMIDVTTAFSITLGLVRTRISRQTALCVVKGQ